MKGEFRMGYILPVERYQYVDYQERIRGEDTSVSAVNRTFRPVLEKNHQEVKTNHERFNPDIYQSASLDIPPAAAIDQAYADITGKGQRINEII